MLMTFQQSTLLTFVELGVMQHQLADETWLTCSLAGLQGHLAKQLPEPHCGS